MPRRNSDSGAHNAKRRDFLTATGESLAALSAVVTGGDASVAAAATSKERDMTPQAPFFSPNRTRVFLLVDKLPGIGAVELA